MSESTLAAWWVLLCLLGCQVFLPCVFLLSRGFCAWVRLSHVFSFCFLICLFLHFAVVVFLLPGSLFSVVICVLDVLVVRVLACVMLVGASRSLVSPSILAAVGIR